jgi:hypothetical protein
MSRDQTNYSGLAVVTHTSSEYEIKDGRVVRSGKPIATRGLNCNCNRRMKNLFIGAASGGKRTGVYAGYLQALQKRGMSTEMANSHLPAKSSRSLCELEERRNVALGIGATTAIFSVVEGLLIKPLPYPQAESLVGVWHTAPGLKGIGDAIQCSPAMYFTYREENQTFQDFGLYQSLGATVTGLAEPDVVPTFGLSRFGQEDDHDCTPTKKAVCFGIAPSDVQLGSQRNLYGNGGSGWPLDAEDSFVTGQCLAAFISTVAR